MFAITNNQMLPLVVVNEKGKQEKAKLVKLVVSKPKKNEAVVIQVVVKIHKN